VLFVSQHLEDCPVDAEGDGVAILAQAYSYVGFIGRLAIS